MTDLLNSRYHLVEILGQGSMGVVWRAHDTVLDREVAIKELRPAAGVDPQEARDRFLVEARAAAKLAHPNIVAVHDVFSDGDRVLITMELVAGPTLAQVVSGAGPATPLRGPLGPQRAEVVRAVMAQVAQALAGAHGAGVVHRDLKPENIFWTPEGRAVVADFGLARIGAGRGTMEGTVMGTPGYMAPEQVRGMVVGPAADVFAWGAVAYELATGRAPFGEASATDPSALAYRIVHQAPPALDLPEDPALAALIDRAMAKDPDDRPADGAELAGLIGLADGDVAPDDRTLQMTRATEVRRTSAPAPSADVPAAEPAPRSSARPGILVGAGIAVVMLFVALVVAVSSPRDIDQVAASDSSVVRQQSEVPPELVTTTSSVAPPPESLPGLDAVPGDPPAEVTTTTATTTMPTTTTRKLPDVTTTTMTPPNDVTTTSTMVTTTLRQPVERELGGLPAITAYCQSLGYDDWTFAKASSGPQTAFDNWSCFKQRPLDMTAACRYQYSRSDASAYARDGNDAYSWRCSAPPPPGYASCAAIGCNDIGDLPNLRGYCQSLGFTEDKLVKPASGNQAAYDNWHCYRRVLIVMDDACRSQYGRSDAYGRPTDPNNPATWRCYVRS